MDSISFPLPLANPDIVIPIQLTLSNAIVPTKGSIGSAGYDLYACEDIQICPMSRKTTNIGVCFQIPEGYYGRVAPRSGLAHKSGINVLGGVIDSDYRGDISVIIHNTSSNFEWIKSGERVAQLIITKYMQKSELLVVKEFLSNTERGIGKFGSTGA
jgi:dUTP pyrophosphatase